MSEDRKRPDFKVYDNGSPIADDVIASVIQITVDDCMDAASIATIKLRDDQARLSDGSKFAIGNEVKVELGYVGKTSEVFCGEVTGWKGGFPRRGNQTFTIVAKDKFHRLRRNKRQKTFLEMKDSEIVTQAAQNAGLSAGTIETTPVKQNNVCQWNQTDADFILSRASMFGYEVSVDGSGKLNFRKPDLGAGASATITWHKELRHFTTTISLAKQSKEVKASAWDMTNKAPIEATSKQGDEPNLMGGTIPGSEQVKDVDGPPMWEPQVPANTPEEIETYAKAIFAKRSQEFVTGEGTCEGNPDILKGKTVEIKGIGTYLEGPYYIKRAIHTLLLDTGYTTTFRVCRTAVQAPAAPPTREREEVEVEPDEPTALLNPDWEGPGPMAADVDAQPAAVAPELEAHEVAVDAAVQGEEPEDDDEEEAETQTLRLTLQDEDGVAMGNCRYELRVGDEVFDGEADPSGKIVQEVPADAEDGELTIWLDDQEHTWPLRVSDHTS